MPGITFDHNNFLVSPRSWESIDRDAFQFRKAIGASTQKYIDVIGILEHVLDNLMGEIELRLIEDKGAETYEGCTSLDGKTIFLRNSVYIGANKGVKRDRFTVAHEIGHAILHAGQTPTMALLSKHPDKPFCQSEAQANRFAAALLVPFELIHPAMNCADVVREFGVSKATAQYRLEGYRKSIKNSGSELQF